MRRRGRRIALALAAAGAGGLAGCVSAPDRCGLIACGTERADLLRVSAEQLAAPPASLQIFDIRHYPGATVAWRVRHGGREDQCREARDPAAPDRVRFVYCRPAT